MRMLSGAIVMLAGSILGAAATLGYTLVPNGRLPRIELAAWGSGILLVFGLLILWQDIWKDAPDRRPESKTGD